jgi:ATP-dependent DNA helicase PIF1
VQKLNNNPTFTLLSKDIFDETDDPHAYLKAMVTEDVMNKYDDPGASPPHELHQKLHDICILMRAVSKADKLATNTRVRITGLSENIVRVSTLDLDVAVRRTASLPRFVFKIKLPYGKSYYITRRQFPLRLAYSLSMNRSQGQTLDRVVVDLTKHCFMHGHLNVAMSRIRDAKKIAVYVSEGDYDDANKMVVTSNVVYPEILTALKINQR